MIKKVAREVIDLAIIIPTLNEEHFIGRLLDSIIKQTVLPKEVVVVDACSKDKTIAEIKKRQKVFPCLRYFQIPKQTISRQRNLGVKKTTSPHLLFLDADMQVQKEDTLEKYFKEVLKRKPDVAAAENLPDCQYWKDLVYFKAENLAIKTIKHFWPLATARNLYVKRQIFNKVRGFDEAIPVGEDHELVQKIVKAGGNLTFLRTVKLQTSTRRVEHEGRRRYAVRMILFGLSIFFRGHKKSKVEYQFGHFNNLAKEKSV